MTPGSWGSIILQFSRPSVEGPVLQKTVDNAARRISELGIRVNPISIQPPSNKNRCYRVEMSFEGVSPGRVSGLRAVLSELGQQLGLAATVQYVPRPFAAALTLRSKL